MSSAAPTLPVNRGQIGARVRRFLDAYAEQGWEKPLEAASRAGFKHPERAVPRLLMRCRLLIDNARLATWQVKHMSEDEAQMYMAEIVRGNIPATPQQVKALELQLRKHGLLTDKVDVALPPGRVVQQLTLVVSGGAQQQLPAPSAAAPVLAEIVSPPTPSHTE